MRNILKILGFFAIAFTSCKKNYFVIESANDFTKLAIGNYWVYESTQFGSTQIDSSVVTHDSIIRGHKYMVVEGHDFSHTWKVLDILRDSSNYIVNNEGAIKFSTVNFTDILYTNYVVNGTEDSILTLKYKMVKDIGTIETPSGVYDDLLTYQGELFSYLARPGAVNPKTDNYHYCKNIGLIKSETNYTQSNDTLVKKLIRYHVK